MQGITSFGRLFDDMGDIFTCIKIYNCCTILPKVNTG